MEISLGHTSGTQHTLPRAKKKRIRYLATAPNPVRSSFVLLSPFHIAPLSASLSPPIQKRQYARPTKGTNKKMNTRKLFTQTHRRG